MSDLHPLYESPTLFPLFSNRLLSKNRPEYHDYLRWLDIQTEISDPIEELAKTGGMRATDSLIVFPCPESESDGRYRISFFGHGIRYLPPQAQQWVEQLERVAGYISCSTTRLNKITGHCNENRTHNGCRLCPKIFC
jgi:hypothetical protein